MDNQSKTHLQVQKTLINQLQPCPSWMGRRCRSSSPWKWGTLVSWDTALGYSDWPSIARSKAGNNAEWQINITQSSQLTRFFREEGRERLYWGKRLEVLPWELNGWLHYGNGKFMYFQIDGCWSSHGAPDIPRWGWCWGLCGWPCRSGIIYPRFIVKLLTASERSGPRSHLASSGQMLNIARLCSIIWILPHSHMSGSHVPGSWEPLSCECHMSLTWASHERQCSEWSQDLDTGLWLAGAPQCSEQVESGAGAWSRTPLKRACHNLNSNLTMKSLKWICVIFKSYQQSCHLPLSN